MGIAKRSFLLAVLGLLLALGLALLLGVFWLGAPNQDLADLVSYTFISGLISILLVWLGTIWLQRGRGRLWLQITLVYTLGVCVALLNVFLTAWLMFISTHDMMLLVLLLLFAAVVSVGLGMALGHGLAQRVAALHHSAQALAENLETHVTPVGNDELADLAHELNRLAALLTAGVADRMRLEASRRDLIIAVSHDLRTPLSSLRVMTEALADDVVPDQETETRYLATMRTQINHLSILIDDLFELAQLNDGVLKLDMQQVTPGDLVSDTIEVLRPQAEAHGITLRGSVAPGVGSVLAAPHKIERVLYNLVTNAIRHTPGDGTVTISVTPLTSTETSTTHHSNPPHPSIADYLSRAAGVLFEVIDTGEGIAQDDLPHVFEQFYRGEKSRARTTGGAGLGLAIARGIVELHGGNMWIESMQGTGTMVRFTLPHE